MDLATLLILATMQSRPPTSLSVETKLFELDTHKKATLNDIYLVHQQGFRERQNTSTIRSELPGNRCAPPMRGKKEGEVVQARYLGEHASDNQAYLEIGY